MLFTDELDVGVEEEEEEGDKSEDELPLSGEEVVPVETVSGLPYMGFTRG